MNICRIDGDYIQLNQFLKKVNIAASGGEARVMIENGIVMVNGSVAHEIRKKLRHNDRIMINGQDEYQIVTE